jgi:hypothetical protein
MPNHHTQTLEGVRTKLDSASVTTQRTLDEIRRLQHDLAGIVKLSEPEALKLPYSSMPKPASQCWKT